MSNLIPEQRLDKNGRLNTKHVRADSETTARKGLLQRLASIPKDAKERNRTIKNLRDDIFEVIDEMRSEDIAVDSARHDAGSKYLKDSIARTNDRYRQQEKGVAQYLHTYSDDTLAWIQKKLPASPSDVLDAFNYHRHSETRMREFLSVVEEMPGFKPTMNLLEHTRESIGVSDMSEYDEESVEHQKIVAVLRVAIEAKRNRYAATSAAGYLTQEEIQERNRLEDHRDSERKQMTPELAAVIWEHPNRVEDIVGFIGERAVLPADVDIDHLTSYLESDSPSIAAGVL